MELKTQAYITADTGSKSFVKDGQTILFRKVGLRGVEDADSVYVSYGVKEGVFVKGKLHNVVIGLTSEKGFLKGRLLSAVQID